MKALVLRERSLAVEEIPSPECPDGHTRLRVLCAALNHRDQYIREGKYARIQLPAVLGSDVCAITEHQHATTRVILDPSFNWGPDPRAQGRDFNILGMPTQGGFAEEICIPNENIHQAPFHLSDEECAALPLAGVTAYRALMCQGANTADDVVVVTGIGGGVATMIALFAIACGSTVVVMSRTRAKIDRFIEGRAGVVGIHTQDNPSWLDELKAMMPTLVVDSIGGDTVNDMLDALVPGGRFVAYGTTTGSVPMLNLHRIYWKQLTLQGSTMGTQQDFINMLAFVNEHKIVPIIDRVYALAEGEAAFDRMKNAEQLGKIVLRP